jgi:hypothetical protein
LFFLCLLDMPYSYFQVVRFAALVGFGLMAYEASQRKATLESHHFHRTGAAFPAIFEGGARPDHLECGGCRGWDGIVGDAGLEIFWEREMKSGLQGSGGK